MVEIQSIKQIKARKPYMCHLCGGRILAGNQYILEKYKDPNGFHTVKRHIHCDAILDVYNQKYNCEEFYHDEEVAETLWQEVCRNICDETQQEECSLSDLFSCELCQRKLLSSPILEEAIKSVKDNYVWED